MSPEAILAFGVKESGADLADNPGAGMYFALDPVASEDYSYTSGGSLSSSHDWILFVLKIPQTSVFLDLNHYDRKLSRKEIRWFKDQGCTVEIRSFSDVQVNECALNAYLKSVSASGYFYNWLKSGFSFCKPNRILNSAAFILRDPKIITPQSLVAFDLESENDVANKPFLSILNSLFPFYNGDPNSAQAQQPWHREALSPVAPTALATFAKTQLIGTCK